MQVSHSRVETFKKCPYQYKLKYKDKLETYFNGDPANPLIIGTALHTGIEKDTPTAIEEYYKNYPVITDKNIDEAIKLETVIQKCKDVLPDLSDALFETKIESREFIGFIDLLIPVSREELTPDDRCYMCRKEDDCPRAYSGNNDCLKNIEVYDMYDFKYSNNIKNYLESGQLHEYKYYFERLNPTKRIRNMYFLFAPKIAIRQKYKNKTNKRDETINEFRTRINYELSSKNATLIKIDYDIGKVKDFLRNAKECRMATTFPKNPTRLCDWCEYQKYCESNEKEDIDIMLPSTERRTVAASNKKKIWLYGAPFSGKTYLANQFPTPLMLNTDGNYKFVDSPVIPIKDKVTVEGRITKRKFAWEVFTEAIDDLEKGSDFETIILDLTEDIYDFCRVKVCNDKGWEHESDDSFKAYDIVRSEFLRTIKRLIALDYNIVLISHEDMSRDITKKSNDKITQIKPNIPDKVALKLAGMVDIVARLINDDDEYTISFKNNEVVFGGGRLKLDIKEIESSYDAICEIYNMANEGKTKANKAKTKTEKPAENTDEEEKPKRKAKAAKAEEKPVEEEPVEEPEVETADAPPVEVETADEPPKRKTRTRKVEEAPEPEAEAPAEEPKEEAPVRRRRRRTE